MNIKNLISDVVQVWNFFSLLGDIFHELFFLHVPKKTSILSTKETKVNFVNFVLIL